MHCKHCAFCLVSVYVPGSHCFAVAVPSGQYLPIGHSFPVVPSVGVADEAAEEQ